MVAYIWILVLLMLPAGTKSTSLPQSIHGKTLFFVIYHNGNEVLA